MVALGGQCMVALGGGMCGCSRGVCMVALGGHAWLLGGVHCCSWGGVHGCSGGACVVAPGGACMVAQGGMHGCSGGCAWDMTRYRDTVNEWAVRILLECILV